MNALGASACLDPSPGWQRVVACSYSRRGESNQPQGNPQIPADGPWWLQAFCGKEDGCTKHGGELATSSQQRRQHERPAGSHAPDARRCAIPQSITRRPHAKRGERRPAMTAVETCLFCGRGLPHEDQRQRDERRDEPGLPDRLGCEKEGCSGGRPYGEVADAE